MVKRYSKRIGGLSMTKENVKMNMDIISAFAEGKTIQYKTVTGVWVDLTESEGLPMGRRRLFISAYC